jgi:hypothetical protein
VPLPSCQDMHGTGCEAWVCVVWPLTGQLGTCCRMGLAHAFIHSCHEHGSGAEDMPETYACAFVYCDVLKIMQDIRRGWHPGHAVDIKCPQRCPAFPSRTRNNILPVPCFHAFWAATCLTCAQLRQSGPYGLQQLLHLRQANQVCVSVLHPAGVGSRIRYDVCPHVQAVLLV